jgi:hypothetical protein
MQLRQAIDGLRLDGGGLVRTFVLEGINRAVGRIGEPPCAAQVDDAHATQKSLGNPLARLLVGSSKKENFNAAAGQQIPRKGLLLQGSEPVTARQLRMNLGQRNAAARRIFGLHAPGKDRGLALEARMAQQEPGQLRARVSRHSHNCRLHRILHDSSIFLSRASTSPAWR